LNLFSETQQHRKLFKDVYTFECQNESQSIVCLRHLISSCALD